MKKSAIVFSLSAIAMGMLACTQAPKTSYTINGDIAGLKDSLIYFRTQSGDSAIIDSAKVADGKFTFKGSAATPKMAAIYLADRKGGFNFYLENADINIKGNADSLNAVKITGAPTQAQFDSYKASIADINTQNDSLFKLYRAASQKNDTATISAIQKQAEKLSDEKEERSKKFISANPKSYVSLSLLSKLVYSTEYKDLNTMFTGLDTTIQHSTGGEKMAKTLETMEKTAIGKPAIDFTQNDVDGKPVSLSSFKGKYVLVDFWASWCGPCRAENPNVVKAYNQYKDKNFTVFGVSLDSKGENWKKAIKDDKLAWTQVSDLKGWKNEAAAKYGVRAIPANFLIDPNGVIIGHNLRGEALEKKLAEVLK